ncbi:MAG: hypothetical protein VKQ33_05815 [Candidatus Sericytochromatia bacterium]|nr:hypothetical protein [Candidatus Sericytochromatia bacterium]
MLPILLASTVTALLAVATVPAGAVPAAPLAVGASPLATSSAAPLGAAGRTHAADWHAPLAGELHTRALRAPARRQRVKELRLIGTGQAVGARPEAQP